MPDDAAFVRLDSRLCLFDAEELIVAADFFDAFVEDDEIVQKVEKAVRLEDAVKLPIQLTRHGSTDIIDRTRIGVAGILEILPLQIVFLRRHDSPIAETFAVVSRHAELDGREERLNKMFHLVGQILPDPIRYGYRTLFEFQHSNRDAVDINDDIRTFGAIPHHRDFLGDRKIIGLRVFKIPIDEIDGLLRRTGSR